MVVLGHGHFGSVRLAVNRKALDEKYAVKTIAKAKLEDITIFKRELEILQQLDHPNVIKFYEVYEDVKYFHIVMQLCSGGELFSQIIKKGHFSEREAANIMHQIVSAINHMHELKICHRDLKPENFLFLNQNADSAIKVIDFGLARKFAATKEMTTIVGTPYYVAPEVLRGTYNQSCDVWSLGVMIYVILVGFPPFNGDNHKEIFENIMHDDLIFDYPEFENISEEAIDLMKKMIVKEPSQRLTASQALRHPWFAKWDEEHSFNKLDPTILESLCHFHVERKLRREALLLMVKLFNEEEIHTLKEAFATVDKDQTGMISMEELSAAMNAAGFELAHSRLREIIDEVDVNHYGKIRYSEFLAATLNTKEHLTQEHLWQVFKHFDIDNTDFITEDNLRHAMERAGKPIDDSEIKLMIQEADFTHDGQISFKEFCTMFQDPKQEVSAS